MKISPQLKICMVLEDKEENAPLTENTMSRTLNSWNALNCGANHDPLQ